MASVVQYSFSETVCYFELPIDCFSCSATEKNTMMFFRILNNTLFISSAFNVKKHKFKGFILCDHEIQNFHIPSNFE